MKRGRGRMGGRVVLAALMFAALGLMVWTVWTGAEGGRLSPPEWPTSTPPGVPTPPVTTWEPYPGPSPEPYPYPVHMGPIFGEAYP